jgi:hypothetical protein
VEKSVRPCGQRRWAHGLWVAAAGGVGFAVSALGSGFWQLARHWFLVPYVVVVGAFLLTYIQWSSMDVGVHLRQHWQAGLLGAIILSLVMVWGVLRQAASSHPQGWELLFALVWLGLVYGEAGSGPWAAGGCSLALAPPLWLASPARRPTPRRACASAYSITLFA